MKLLNALRCDLNKAVVNIGFLGAAAVTTILCFTASVYNDSDIGKSYSVFEVLFALDKSIIASDRSLSSLIVFQYALSGYVSMFMPIIVAFPFMVSFCSERNSGLMRMTIPRSGKYPYYFSKFLASFISGGLAVLIGTAVFGIVCALIFPDISSYDISAEELQWILPDGVFPAVVKVLLGGFLYGAISTLPAFFLSSFCKNPYIITCLPFMLVFVWNTAVSKIVSKGFETGNYEVYTRLSPFMPDSIMNVLRYSDGNGVIINTLIFNGAYLAILLAGHIAIMNKRTDKGA